MALIQEKGLIVFVRANTDIFVRPGKKNPLFSQFAIFPKLRIMQYYADSLLSKWIW